MQCKIFKIQTEDTSPGGLWSKPRVQHMGNENALNIWSKQTLHFLSGTLIRECNVCVCFQAQFVKNDAQGRHPPSSCDLHHGKSHTQVEFSAGTSSGKEDKGKEMLDGHTSSEIRCQPVKSRNSYSDFHCVLHNACIQDCMHAVIKEFQPVYFRSTSSPWWVNSLFLDYLKGRCSNSTCTVLLKYSLGSRHFWSMVAHSAWGTSTRRALFV